MVGYVCHKMLNGCITKRIEIYRCKEMSPDIGLLLFHVFSKIFIRQA